MTSRSRLSGPFPTRDRSLSAAHPPTLTLRPVEFSLTDGTNIPPPEKEVEKPTNSLSPARTPSPGPGSGPLSSHPVTPIDGVDSYAFPSLETSNTTTTATTTTNGNAFTFPPRSYTDTHSSSTLDARDDSTPSQHSQQPPSQNSQYHHQEYPPHPQAYQIPSHPPNTWETQRTHRRPSIAQRFLSSLRSRSRSSSLQSTNNYSRPPSRSSTMLMNNASSGPFELDGTSTSNTATNNSRHLPRRASRLSLTLARLTSSHPTPAPVPTITSVERGTPGPDSAYNQYQYANNGITPRELALGDSPLPSRPATGRTSMTLSGGGGDRRSSGVGIRKRSFDWFSSLPIAGGDRDQRRRAQSASWALGPDMGLSSYDNAYTAATVSGGRSYAGHTH
ncbi:MAG: hypothetical protein INR71_10110, partial [Terriglobus roseus]|nr:hypothetical protein [Terriglobus roseus]